MNLNLKFLRPLLVVLVCNTIVFAQNSLNYIPNDAQNIYVLDLKSISSKVDFKTIQNMDFFKEIGEGKMDEAKGLQYLKNPAESGVDFNKPFVVAQAAVEGSVRTMMTIVVPLTDRKKFEKMLSQMPNQPPLSKENDISYFLTDSTLSAWNNEAFVIKFFSKEKTPDLSKLGGAQTDDNTDDSDSTKAAKAVKMVEYAAEEQARLKGFLPTPNALFKMEAENDRRKAVMDLMQKPHDIYIYRTSKGSGKNPMVAMATMMLGVSAEEMEGNSTYGWFDFENGRMYGETKQVINEGLKAKFGQIFNAKPRVDWNQIIQLDSKQKPLVVMSLSLNPLGITKMMEENEMLKMGVSSMEKKTKGKFDIKTVINNMKGDIFVTGAIGEKGPDFLIGMNVNDEKAVAKIIEKDMEGKKLTKNMYTFESKKAKTDDDQPKKKKPEFLALVRDGILFVGSEAKIRTLAEKPNLLQAAQNVAVSQPWEKALQSQTFNLFFDFASLKGMIPSGKASEMDKIPMESMRMTMGNGLSEFEIKTTDADKNALMSIVSWLDTEAKNRKNKLKELETEEKKD